MQFKPTALARLNKNYRTGSGSKEEVNHQASNSLEMVNHYVPDLRTLLHGLFRRACPTGLIGRASQPDQRRQQPRAQVDRIHR